MSRICRCCGLLCAVLIAVIAVAVSNLHRLDLRELGFHAFLLKLTLTYDFLAGVNPDFWGNRPFRHIYKTLPDLSGKVAVVTGANSGVGYWTALHLARNGAHVVPTCRSMDKCESAAKQIRSNLTSAVVTPMILDVSSLASVRSFAASFLKDFSSLDILVLNAGIGYSHTNVSSDNIDMVFATNHVGHFLLYKLLADLISSTADAAGDARVVAVSSCEHWRSYPDGVALTRAELNRRAALPSWKKKSYSQSKLANILFVQEAARRTAHKPIFINAVHPGYALTNIFESGARERRKEPEGPRPEADKTIIATFIRYFDLAHRSGWTAEEGALTQIYLAASTEVKDLGYRGRYFHPQVWEVLPHRQHTRNSTLQRAVWDFTEALINGSA